MEDTGKHKNSIRKNSGHNPSLPGMAKDHTLHSTYHSNHTGEKKQYFQDVLFYKVNNRLWLSFPHNICLEKK